MLQQHAITVRDVSGTWVLPIRVSARARRVFFAASASRGIELVVPRGADLRGLEALVEAHRDWLERRRAEYAEAARPIQPPERIALGTPKATYTVQYRSVPGARSRLREPEPGRLVFEGDRADPIAVARVFQAWLKAQARAVLPPLLETVAAGTGLSYRHCRIRLTRSRWGSCSRRRCIMLSASLLFLPEELVRHVMVHELCHTHHMNHSPAFWALVARHDPQWRSLRRRMREAGRARVPSWVYR